MPWVYALASLALTIAGYLALVSYDWLALRFIRRALPIHRVLIPSFISYAVSNNAPASVVTGGGVRYRLYSSLGLSATEMVAVAAFDVATYVAGLLTVAGVAFVLAPVSLPGHAHLHLATVRPLGVVFLLLILTAVLTGRPGGRELQIRRWTIRIPGRSMLLQQVVISSFDWILSSAALYVLLRAAGPVPYLPFLSAFLLAQMITLIAPLPGGVGVFEAIILLLHPGHAPAPAVLGALLVYRVVYYLLPLLAAALLLAFEERRIRQAGGISLVEPLVRGIVALAPQALAVVTFLGGITLLATGTLPARPGRMQWLGRLFPLAIIEASHFLGSIVGTALIMVAWGLARRVRFAFDLTVLLILMGVPLALLRGLDFVAAGVLVVLLLALWPARGEFNRLTSLREEPLALEWALAFAAALFAGAWLSRFAYSNDGYSGDLWWRFALQGNASRALRAAVGVAMTVLVFALARLLRPVRRHKRGPE